MTVVFKHRDHFNRRGEPKIGYATKREARREARLHNRGEPHAYRCPFCPSWHLGGTVEEEES